MCKPTDFERAPIELTTWSLLWPLLTYSLPTWIEQKEWQWDHVIMMKIESSFILWYVVWVNLWSNQQLQHQEDEPLSHTLQCHQLQLVLLEVVVSIENYRSAWWLLCIGTDWLFRPMFGDSLTSIIILVTSDDIQFHQIQTLANPRTSIASSVAFISSVSSTPSMVNMPWAT